MKFLVATATISLCFVQIFGAPTPLDLQRLGQQVYDYGRKAVNTVKTGCQLLNQPNYPVYQENPEIYQQYPQYRQFPQYPQYPQYPPYYQPNNPPPPQAIPSTASPGINGEEIVKAIGWNEELLKNLRNQNSI